jgi:hypothetical protein
MKPTQEQIEAALRYADEKDTSTDRALLLKSAQNEHRYTMATLVANIILAAAYRDAMAEIERLNDQIENIELEGDEIAEMRDYAD